MNIFNFSQFRKRRKNRRFNWNHAESGEGYRERDFYFCQKVCTRSTIEKDEHHLMSGAMAYTTITRVICCLTFFLLWKKEISCRNLRKRVDTLSAMQQDIHCVSMTKNISAALLSCFSVCKFYALLGPNKKEWEYSRWKPSQKRERDQLCYRYRFSGPC